jgi:TPR repeat protein
MIFEFTQVARTIAMDEPLKAAAPKPCCDAPNGKHCTKCKSRHYCSKKCQLVDWNEGGHKVQCRQLAAVFQDRLLDELMPKKKVKEEPAIVDDIAPAAGFKAVARLPAARSEKAGEAGAVKNDTLDWRGTCAICLDLLPVESGGQAFYECCCTKICTECNVKCQQYDHRCPLCRSAPSKSNAELVRRLQKHVDEGNADAQIMLGEAYREGALGLKKSFKRAVRLHETAAAQGHAEAQTALGRRYELGQGVKLDLKTSAQWYRRAAEQGHPIAQYYLGGMLYFGTGEAQSHDEAAKWYGLAAAQGNTEALCNLGGCYGNGHGVPQDLDEALRLYKRAAAKGHAEAAAAVGAMEAHRL